MVSNLLVLAGIAVFTVSLTALTSLWVAGLVLGPILVVLGYLAARAASVPAVAEAGDPA